MLKGKTALPLVYVILADPVHVAYIEAGYCMTGVCANGCPALSDIMSDNGDIAETSILKLDIVGFLCDRSSPAKSLKV